MVKRNIFLRVAVLLFVVCMASASVFSGTVTFAKYIAAGEGNPEARVAKFSFKVTDRPYQGDSTWGNTPEEIAVTAGVPTTFSVPLFDTDYLGTGGVTVSSRDGDPLIAPGIGHHIGAPVHKGLIATEWDYNFHRMTVQNNSEVAVRFRIMLDSAVLPGDVKIFIRGVHYSPTGGNPTGVESGSTFAELGDPGDPYVMDYNADTVIPGTTSTTFGDSGFAVSTPWINGEALSDGVAGGIGNGTADKLIYDWYYLPPNSEPVNRWITWMVCFSPDDGRGVWSGAMTGNFDHPAGMTPTEIADETAAKNAADTALGKLAAKALDPADLSTQKSDVEVELKFRIEVEQVD